MSKEYLEAFKIVYNNFDYLISDVVIENDDVNICLKTIKEQLPTIEQALLKAQEPKKYVDELKLVEKKLKALEIIKEKRIDIESFYSSFIESDYDYNFYEKRYGTYGKYELTEEEFNLLKEVLE